MNINEVIANRALELLNLPKGKYDTINPNDHVNMSQSSNDVFPTAMRITALNLGGRLLEALSELEDVLWSKADEFDHVLKSARTHLRDAVPIRLGQEFGAYAVTIGKVSRHVHIAMENLKELNIGGTAVGTGINSTIAYRVIALDELKKYTSMEDLRPPESWVEVTQSAGDFLDISRPIRDTAVALMKIAGDIILMYSGPMTGLAEIDMQVTQAGSSIIPGKVNPSMAEMLEMVCCQVIGNGTTIAHAARSAASTSTQ